MYYPNSSLINQLERQKDNIDNLLHQYTAPVQNIITTGCDFEARFITDEDISNIPIMKKTLFIDEKNKTDRIHKWQSQTVCKG